MNGWLLDTNVVAELSGARPEPRVARWAESLPERLLFLSILTIGEYRKGVHNLAPADKRRPRLLRSIAALEARFAGRVLAVSEEVVLRWGAISGEAKRRTGHSPSVIDTLLAATAIEHGLYFATRNTAHVEQSGAVVFNPWKDDPSLFPL